MRNPKQIDLRWTWAGDLVIGQDGDIKDTSENELLSFAQEVQTRVRSGLYDWALQPHIGAGLVDLIGEPNNRETAEAGKTKLISALIKDSFLDASRINIKYMPVGNSKLIYRIKLSVPDTTEDVIFTLTTLVDTDEFSVLFI